MEAEEDDHSNVNKPSLQVEHGSAQSDAHVEDPQSGEQQCKFESFSEPEEVPLVIGGQSEPTLVSVKNDGDVFSGEDRGAVGADVEIKKTNLVENMELAEKIGADMGESTVEEVVEPKIEADMVEIAVEEIVEAKSETFVAETDVERQNYVADVIAGAVEDEKVAPHVTESSVDETFAADGPEEKEVELASSLGGVSVDKEMTEGESVANEVNDTRLVDMGDGVQYTEKIGVTNEVEETNGAQKEDDPDVEEKAGMEKEEFLVMEGRDSSFPLEQEKDEVYAADLLNGTLLEEEKEMFNVTEESSEAVEVNTLPQENAQTREKDYVEDLADKVGEISNVADETVKVEGMANVEAGSLETEDLSSAADEMAELEEMANGEDETTEAETMAAMGDEAVEMANMGDDTIEAVEMANVGDETIEAEEMEASVNDMVGEMTEAEETEAVDEVEEMEVVEEASRGINGSKRKRGKNAKAPARALSRKKVEEDVCFICFDGGDLVLCDRRSGYIDFHNINI